MKFSDEAAGIAGLLIEPGLQALSGLAIRFRSDQHFMHALAMLSLAVNYYLIALLAQTIAQRGSIVALGKTAELDEPAAACGGGSGSACLSGC